LKNNKQKESERKLVKRKFPGINIKKKIRKVKSIFSKAFGIKKKSPKRKIIPKTNSLSNKEWMKLIQENIKNRNKMKEINFNQPKQQKNNNEEKENKRHISNEDNAESNNNNNNEINKIQKKKKIIYHGEIEEEISEEEEEEVN